MQTFKNFIGCATLIDGNFQQTVAEAVKDASMQAEQFLASLGPNSVIGWMGAQSVVMGVNVAHIINIVLEDSASST